MKRILALLLSALLLFSAVPVAFAATTEQEAAAQELYTLGLFQGIGTDANGDPIFALDRPPTRIEGIVMLVRLLGAEYTATHFLRREPFVDVPRWATGYTGYAYANGLTNGVDATHFGSEKPVTASQYLTFVLRALGYESGSDFAWDSAWTLSDQLGFTNGQYNASTKEFTRGDAALVSYNALSVCRKGTSETLLEFIERTAGSVLPEEDKAPSDVLELIQYSWNSASDFRGDAVDYYYKALNARNNSVSQHVYIMGMTNSFDIACLWLDSAIEACGDYGNLADLKHELTLLNNILPPLCIFPENQSDAYPFLMKASPLMDQERSQYKIAQNVYQAVLETYAPR